MDVGPLVTHMKQAAAARVTFGIVIEDEDDELGDHPAQLAAVAWRKERRGRTQDILNSFAVSPAIRGMSGTRGEFVQPRMAIMSGELSDRATGKFRVTFFGPDGPLGHVTKDSHEAIAAEVLESLYPPIAPMTDEEVIAWTTTPEFEMGSRIVAYMQAENTLRWFAQKAGKLDWAYEVIARGHHGVDQVQQVQTIEALEAATKLLTDAIATLPVPNPRRHLVANPPWVTAALADSYEVLDDKVPPEWLPQLAGVLPGRGTSIRASLVEYGCGAYGCVLATLDPATVLKVTSDLTESEFAAQLSPTLVAPICVEYRMVVRLSAKHHGAPIHLLWREAADHVGEIVKVLGGEQGRLAGIYIDQQHAAGQAAFDAAMRKRAPAIVHARVNEWLDTCEAMAHGKVPELHELGRGLVEIYRQQKILFGDIHAGNLGLVHGRWVITDPGNVTVIQEQNMSYVRHRIAGGKSAGMSPRQFDPVELARGTKVEMEHTSDRKIAQEIAMDHLVEDPRYYQKLARIHRD